MLKRLSFLTLVKIFDAKRMWRRWSWASAHLQLRRSSGCVQVMEDYLVHRWQAWNFAMKANSCTLTSQRLVLMASGFEHAGLSALRAVPAAYHICLVEGCRLHSAVGAVAQPLVKKVCVGRVRKCVISTMDQQLDKTWRRCLRVDDVVLHRSRLDDGFFGPLHVRWYHRETVSSG